VRDNINIQLIINGCLKGNLNSQRTLFEHFCGYAMNVCLRYAKNREEAEEILNSGFLKVLRRIHQYDQQFPFTAWLRKIMVNTAIDYHRAKKKYPDFLELNSEIEIADSPMPDFDDQEDVLPILQQLPPMYRMVFNLYVIEEYRHDEIAAMLNISSSTSRSNLARAKERLRVITLQKKQKSKVS